MHLLYFIIFLKASTKTKKTHTKKNHQENQKNHTDKKNPPRKPKKENLFVRIP